MSVPTTTSRIGAAPEGAVDEHGVAVAVQAMFNSIAPRYDLLNHVLSANIDRLWWRRTARRFRDVLKQPDAAIAAGRRAVEVRLRDLATLEPDEGEGTALGPGLASSAGPSWASPASQRLSSP